MGGGFFCGCHEPAMPMVGVYFPYFTHGWGILPMVGVFYPWLKPWATSVGMATPLGHGGVVFFMHESPVAELAEARQCW
jgi:hypothetical protein